MTDRELLAEYAAKGSKEAFDRLAKRHAGLVYSACLRALGDRHAAEDAAQATFLIFLRKASRLSSGTVLSGWLFLTARAVCRDARKREARRARREKEAAEMRSREAGPDERWTRVGPHLDAALAALPAAQRDAVLLRYMRGLSEAEICAEAGCGQSTVAMRLKRGLEKLRARLARRGAVVPAATLGALLAGNAVETAPAGLVGAVQALGAGSAASAAAVAMMEGAMKAMMITKIKLVAAAVIAATVVCGGGTLAVKLAAGEPKAAPKVTPKSPDMVPLNAKWPKKKWPSRNPVPYRDDPAIVAKLKALGERTGLMLGKFKVAPADAAKWHGSFKRGPSRRGFCNKMPYAPDRKTAMYCGADHGTPHGLNDVWEFHLGSNSWNLILPPASDKHRYAGVRNAMHRARKLVEKGVDVEKNKAIIKEKEAYMRKWWSKMSVAEGYIQSPNGGPVYPWHTWDGLTYDTRTKRLYWAELSSDNVGKRHAVQVRHTRNYAKFTGKDAEKLVAMIRPGTSMYAYDSAEGRWMRQMGAGPFPNMRGMGGSLHYIPDIDKTIWYCNVYNTVGGRDGMWTYDAKTNKWSQLLSKGQIAGQVKSGAAPGEELQMAYSSKHKKLVSVQGRRTFTYDVKANRWSKAAACPGYASDSQSVFDYDSGADVFIFVYKDAPGKRGYSDEPWRLAAYDLKTDKWEVVKIKGQNLPQDPKRVPGRNWVGRAFAGYYDPGHNVFVLYVGNQAMTWVYRHKKAEKK